MNRTVSGAACVAFALVSSPGCQQWRVVDATVEPTTLTAGSDEFWSVRVDVADGFGTPYPTAIYLYLNPPAWTALPTSETSAWFWLYDTGTWGDTEAGDLVFERTGVHPFVEEWVPGTYTLGVQGSPEDDPFLFEIEILPPP